MIYIEIKSLKAEERIETLWDYAPFLSENENRITLKMEYEERCVEIKKEKNEKWTLCYKTLESLNPKKSNW